MFSDHKNKAKSLALVNNTFPIITQNSRVQPPQEKSLSFRNEHVLFTIECQIHLCRAAACFNNGHTLSIIHCQTPLCRAAPRFRNELTHCRELSVRHLFVKRWPASEANVQTHTLSRLELLEGLDLDASVNTRMAHVMLEKLVSGTGPRRTSGF